MVLPARTKRLRALWWLVEAWSYANTFEPTLAERQATFASTHRQRLSRPREPFLLAPLVEIQPDEGSPAMANSLVASNRLDYLLMLARVFADFNVGCATPSQ